MKLILYQATIAITEIDFVPAESCVVTLAGSGCGFSETQVALEACRFDR